MKSIAVVGVGNILFLDEGMGCYASRFLKENYTFTPPVEVVDGGTLGFKLMDFFQDYDKVLILDTVSIADEPGSIFNLTSEVLMGLGSYRQTAHEVEVVEMLEICSILDKVAEVNVIGVVPESIASVVMDLTPPLRQAFPLLIHTVLSELENAGVRVTPKSNRVTLDGIIEAYSMPVHPDLS